jgi:F-type H+-transporting ATPase subunit b
MESSLGQLGINWNSMLLYAVNFGLLFFILQRFLNKKVLAILDDRRQHIETSLKAAENLQQEVATEKAKLNQEMQAMRNSMQIQNQQLRASLEAEKTQALAEVETYRAEALARVKAEAENMRQQFFAEIQTELRTAVQTMLFRILGKHVNERELDDTVPKPSK